MFLQDHFTVCRETFLPPGLRPNFSSRRVSCGIATSRSGSRSRRLPHRRLFEITKKTCQDVLTDVRHDDDVRHRFSLTINLGVHCRQ